MAAAIAEIAADARIAGTVVAIEATAAVIAGAGDLSVADPAMATRAGRIAGTMAGTRLTDGHN